VRPFKYSGIDLIPAELLQTSGRALPLEMNETAPSILNKDELR